MASRFLGLILLAFSAPLTLGGQSREETAISLVNSYMTQHSIPGVAVAIVDHGEIVFSTELGVADLEMGVQVTKETLFRTASTLKPITAVAVLALSFDGSLNLDAPIQEYCPEYPRKRWPVTARDLLGHEAGVRSSVFADIFNRQHYGSIEHALKRFALDSLVAEPGTASVYSNGGYTLLACAVEGASGVPYDDYLHDHVLTPAGMTKTRPDNPFEIIAGRARGYMMRTEENTERWKGLWQPRHLQSTELGVLFNADLVDPSWSPGAGGYLTTPIDLVRFASVLMAGRLLPPDFVAQIPVPHELATGEQSSRSFGWVLGKVNGSNILQVLGSDWNGSSGLWVLPAEGFAIAVSTNKGFEQPSQLVESLARLWGKLQPPQLPDP
jgi:serine beta-lactamase-like protein LACTB